MAYVYRHIRLDKNEPFYIGIGSDEEGKFVRAYQKGRNDHWNNIVKISKYDIEIILDDISWEEACSKEQEFIQLYGRSDLKNGTLVNMTDGGEGTLNFSPEIRKKISDAHKGEKNHMFGKKHTEENKRKIGESVSKTKKENPIIFSEEHKRKIGISKKGRKMSDYNKLKLKEANTNRIFSEETRLKLSKIHKGRKLSKEHIQKLSESHKGKVGGMKGKNHSNKTKIKISNAQQGRKISEEQKLKLSIAAKKYWNKKNG